MTEPIVITVKRHKCPCCGKSYANKGSAVAHINRCWHNPAAKGCKTCRHYEPADSGDWEVGDTGLPEFCQRGVDLTVPCRTCEVTDDVVWSERVGVEQVPGYVELSPCGACNGTRRDPDCLTRPIVHCDLWEAS